MSQYADLDKAILDRLDGGGDWPLHFLFAHEVRRECERLAKATGRESFRVMDGRLQALRKAGKIAYDTKTGWSLKDQQP